MVTSAVSRIGVDDSCQNCKVCRDEGYQEGASPSEQTCFFLDGSLLCVLMMMFFYDMTLHVSMINEFMFNSQGVVFVGKVLIVCMSFFLIFRL